MLTEIIQEDYGFRTGVRMWKERGSHNSEIVGVEMAVFPPSAIHTPWGMPFDPIHHLFMHHVVPGRYVGPSDLFVDQATDKTPFRVRYHSGPVKKIDTVPRPSLMGLGESLKKAFVFLMSGGTWPGDFPNAAYQEYKKGENPCTHASYRGSLITNGGSNVYEYTRVPSFNRMWRADTLQSVSSGGTITNISPVFDGWGSPGGWESYTQSFDVAVYDLQQTIAEEQPYRVSDNWYCYLTELTVTKGDDPDAPNFGAVESIHAEGYHLVRPFGWAVEVKIEWSADYVFTDYFYPKVPLFSGTQNTLLSEVYQVWCDYSLVRQEYYRCRQDVDCADDIPTDWTPVDDWYILPSGEFTNAWACTPFFHDLPVSYVSPGFNETRLHDLVTKRKSSYAYDPGRETLLNTGAAFAMRDVVPEVVGGLALSAKGAVEDAIDLLLDSNVETIIELSEISEQVAALIQPFELSYQIFRRLRRGDAWGAGTTALDLISSSYLLYKFGIAPNIDAARQVARAFWPIVERLLNGEFRQYMIGRGKFNFALPDAPRGVEGVVVRFKTKASLRYSDNSIVSALLPYDMFGMLPMTAAFWDTRTASWFIDWYANLGAKFSFIDSQIRLLMLDIAGSTSSIAVDIPISEELYAHYGSVSLFDAPLVTLYLRTVQHDMPPFVPPRKYDFYPASMKTDWKILSALAYQLSK